MARIRSIKPEVRRSLTVGQWPREVRLAWIYLWNYLDDEGRGLDDMRLVVAECFPVDRDVTEKKMDRWLTLMATTKSLDDDLPPLCRYEVAGQRYMHALKWSQHQRINRPSPSRIPPCPIHERSVKPHGTFTESFTEGSLPDSRLSRAPAEQGAGSREQGTRDQGARVAEPTHTRDEPASQTIDADQLITTHVGKVTGAVRLGLRDQITTLANEGLEPATITAALTAWAQRPGSGPGLLAYLANDALLDDQQRTKPRHHVNGSAPPWCGHCDQTNRWEDTGNGWRRCPTCHPLNATASVPTAASEAPAHSGQFAGPDDPPF